MENNITNYVHLCRRSLSAKPAHAVSCINELRWRRQDEDKDEDKNEEKYAFLEHTFDAWTLEPQTPWIQGSAW